LSELWSSVFVHAVVEQLSALLLGQPGRASELSQNRLY
jgi:hypothetical protein